MWVNEDDDTIIIKNPSEFEKRRIENKEDRESLIGKFKNSISRTLSRISSPDENYRVLIRDISILSFWFSIIFSDFMLVAGVRNDVIKGIIKRDKPIIENENPIAFIQAQLDFMNDIHNMYEYKQLVKESGITEVGDIREQEDIAVAAIAEKEKYISGLIADSEKIINEMKIVNSGGDTTNISTLNDLLNSDDNRLLIEKCSNKIIENYRILANDEKYASKTNEFLNTIYEALDLDEKAIKDCKNDCMLAYLPIITNYTILVNVYKELSKTKHQFQMKLIAYQNKLDGLLSGLNTSTDVRDNE